MKKLASLMTFLVVIFAIFLYVYLTPRDYSVEYEKNGFNIIEEYHKEEKTYYFEISNDKWAFDYVKEDGYSSKRELINKIIINDNCQTVVFKNETLGKRCFEEYQEVPYEDISLKHKSKYKGNSIFEYSDKTYAVWNYKEVVILKENKNQVVEIFEEDVYDNRLMTLVDNLLIIPNYENLDYQEFYLINLKNGQKENWKIDYEISRDSYILGTYEKEIYIVDRKNKKEYKINPFKKKIELIEGTIYNNGFESISMQKLINEDLSFNIDSIYNYRVEDNILYLNYFDKDLKTKVADFDGGHIVSIQNETIYYLIKDKLYSFNPEEGKVLLIENFEWNFNYQNKIFIYNK